MTMYNESLLPLENMENFHNNLIFIKKWAVYSTLRSFYDSDSNNITITIDEVNFHGWETLINTKNWIVSKIMHTCITDFKLNFVNNIDVDEFEGYVICKLFLDAIFEENVKRLPLMLGRFKATNKFFAALNYLYNQKFNISKVKQILHFLFFDFIDQSIPENMQFNVVQILSNVTIDKVPTIKIKKLLPYVNYINNYHPCCEETLIINTVNNKFKNQELVDINSFYELAFRLYIESKCKQTQKMLKDLFYDKKIKQSVNNLNKLYGNILLLALFNKKEENSTYHNTLYQDLEQCL
ncbi:CmNV_071-like protein [Aratus pisonii nudivirus]|nr:CmNV_071-like protein [Aratus pisonii nudivirus]